MSPIITRAIVSRGPLSDHGWQMETVHLRAIQKDELVVRIIATGICHTDILTGNLKEGPTAIYPSVKGHEGSGIVEQIGDDVTVAKPGDPVVLSFASCGACGICASGHPAHCVNHLELNFKGNKCFSFAGSIDSDIFGGFFGHSSFANVTIVDQSSVVNLKGVADVNELKVIAALGCGVQTGSGSIINVGKAGPQDTVAVIGLGGVGLAAVMAAKLRGCATIIGIDRVESRMSLAVELGATHTINTSELKSLVDIVQSVRDLTNGSGTSITVDTTGFVPLIEQGFTFTRACGKFIQSGSAPFDSEMRIPMFQNMVDGKSYIGTAQGDATPEYIPRLIGWYKSGRFPVDRLVAFYKADEWQKAVDDTGLGKTVKPVLVW